MRRFLRGRSIHEISDHMLRERDTHLLAGFFSRHEATKSSRGLPYECFPPSRFNAGDGSSMSLARIFSGEKYEFGALPNVSSRAVIPSDQISAFESYGFRSIISGAIQQGVPTKLLRVAAIPFLAISFSDFFVVASRKRDEETPKSARSTVPSSSTSRFAALISR